MRKNSPLISVILPVYNAGRYVGQAIESILGQTLGDFELIVIDDGSTDSSSDVIKRYAAEDDRVVLVGRKKSDKIQYFLSHPEEWDRIALAGYVRAAGEHTYEKKAWSHKLCGGSEGEISARART